MPGNVPVPAAAQAAVYTGSMRPSAGPRCDTQVWMEGLWGFTQEGLAGKYTQRIKEKPHKWDEGSPGCDSLRLECK